MNTTNLFVELVVIGIGVFAWVGLLVIAAFGYNEFALSDISYIIAALPTLALVYVLGIVWDRFADFVFKSLWDNVLKSEQYSSVSNYYDDRRIILTHSPALSELLEYGRSRLRICRGWALNALAISLSLSLYLVLDTEINVDSSVLIVGIVSFLVLSVGCGFAWSNLSRSEYRKIKQQSAFLNRERERGVDKDK